MKKTVASAILVTSVVLGATIASGQTARGAKKQRVSEAPRSAATLKICQGLTIPAGYTIVGYITSPACLHGAYLVKKDETQFARPITGVDDNQPGPTRSAAPARTSVPSSQKGAAVSQRNSSTNPAKGTVAPVSPGSRPRRVGDNANAAAQNQTASAPTQYDPNVSSAGSQNDPEPVSGPPVLIGAGPRTATGPPVLRGTAGNAVGGPPALTGSGATGDPVAGAANAAAGPEKVDEGDVLKIDTAFVTVPVSVLDRQGRFIPNLKKEDFSIFENGIEQKVTTFDTTEKPFTVALLLDTSASTKFHIGDIQEAAIAFAKQLRPQDRVLVISFNDEVLLLTEATNDQNLITEVIRVNAQTGNSTRLYDAVQLAVTERLNRIKGRKAIVLFTDGVDTSSQLATYDSTLSDVEELDALIYPIKYDTSDYLRAIQNQGGTVTVVTTTRGGWGGWGAPYSDIDVDYYTERSVVIDIYDGPSRRPVWHGVGSNREYRDNVNYAKLNEAIVAALAKFPPQPEVAAR